MIHVEDLTKDYGDTRAVDQISFNIDKGEILGFLGPNGAGKTTTMRMLTGFLTPTNGKIRVKDFDMDEKPLQIKRMMGYLPESAPLYHDMLVFDYLDYVAAIRGLVGEKKNQRLLDLSELCGLKSVMHKPVAELSKGFKQRAGLAHAMMSDPEILVLDEPTSGLDPNQIVEIREIIKKIGREKTVILSTHILSEAEATCDRVLIINQGKIAADGNLADLKTSAGDRKKIHLSLSGADPEAVSRMFSEMSGIRAITLGEDSDDRTISAALTCESGEDPREEIYKKIRETDWILLEMRRESRNLETVFRELTTG